MEQYKCARRWTIPMVLAATAALGACSQHPSWNEATAPDSKASPVEIKAFFDQKGCPVKVNEEAPEFKAGRGDKVEWRAYRRTSGEPVFDPSIEFAVYFDPFVDGKPIVSNKGVARSARINANTPQQYPGGPKVEYKYTILSDGCAPNALDPRMRILR